MLVLTHKEGEILQVGDNIRIYIKRIRGNQVRLCIEAPREISLVRIPAPQANIPLELSAEDEGEEAG